SSHRLGALHAHSLLVGAPGQGLAARAPDLQARRRHRLRGARRPGRHRRRRRHLSARRDRAVTTIRPADNAADMDTARALFREYADWLGIDLSFQGFEEELAGLPGDYAPPQ